MVKILIIGPLTKDRIIYKEHVFDTVGGAVYYQSAVFSEFGIDNTVITTLSHKDMNLLEYFKDKTQIIPLFAEKTMEFENSYPDDDPNHRIQKSVIPENPIYPLNLKDVELNQYDSILLSPLSPYDIPLETIQYLSTKGIPIYLGAQGYLRRTEDNQVGLKQWDNYESYLKLVKILFLDELEAQILLKEENENAWEIARKLAESGPEEVIITRGDLGAIVYSSKYGNIYELPVYPPKIIADPTGLGDTFMAAYALKKLETDDPHLCGEFASRIASHKMEHKGAFRIK